MTELLTGAYIELYHRVGAADTLLAFTKDDVSIAFNPEVRETKEHNSGRVIKKATHDAPVISFGGLIVTSIGAVETLGFATSGATKTLTGYGDQCPLDDIVFLVYECEGDASPKQEVVAEDVVMVLSDMSWPNEDFAMWSGEFHVNGSLELTPNPV